MGTSWSARVLIENNVVQECRFLKFSSQPNPGRILAEVGRLIALLRREEIIQSIESSHAVEISAFGRSLRERDGHLFP